MSGPVRRRFSSPQVAGSGKGVVVVVVVMVMVRSQIISRASIAV